MINAKRLWNHLEHLCVEIGPRLTGTPGGHRASEYIASHFRRFTKDVEMQEYPCPSWEHISTELALFANTQSPHPGPGQGMNLPAFAQVFSHGCDLEASIACVGTLHELEYAPGLEERILVLHGEVASAINGDRNAVLLIAEERRAAGLIVVDARESVSTKLIRDPHLEIPAVAVSVSAGLELLRNDGAKVRLKVDARRFDSTGRNVVARLGASHEDGSCIIVAAHYDTAAECPGAGDNGTGTAAILELIEAFAEATSGDTDIDLLFVAYDAEEYGRHAALGQNLGSVSFTRRNPDVGDAAVCVVEADLVGSLISPLHLWYGPGWPPDGLERIGAGMKRHPDHVPEHRGHSGAFAIPGVPGLLFVNTWEQIPIHTQDDTIDLISPSALERAVSAIYEVIDSLRRA